MRITEFGAQPTVEVDTSTALAKVEEVPSEREFLDFSENKVQAITLAQLERTNMENRGDDRSCPHGIYHYDLIQRILDMAEKSGYTPEVYDLFATNNKDKQTAGVSLYPELEEKYGPRAVEAHTLRRIFCNIRLADFDEAGLTMNFAICYTQKGIQVGFGSNVSVCHNQNMMGAGHFVADYSIHNHYAHGEETKTDLNGIFQKIGTWLTDAEKVFITDRAEIKKMQDTVIDAQTLFTILGILHTTRVCCDTADKEIRYKGILYPLNQMQLNKFTEALVKKQKQQSKVTAWDFYNCATELYKPYTCEQNLILPQAMAMSGFMRQYEIY